MEKIKKFNIKIVVTYLKNERASNVCDKSRDVAEVALKNLGMSWDDARFLQDVLGLMVKEDDE